MSDIKEKAKETIDSAADSAKKATETVVDKTKDLAHQAGKKMEDAGDKLRNA